MSCQSRCSFPLLLTPGPAGGAEHLGRTTQHLTASDFSNETSMKSCTGRSTPFQIQHSSSCLFPWLPIPSWCTARAADKPSQPSCHSHFTASDATNTRACHESQTACTRQTHAPECVCSRAGEQGSNTLNRILLRFGNDLRSREESKGKEKSSQKCLRCDNVNNANISAFKYVWNDRECQHLPHLPRNSFESLLP